VCRLTASEKQRELANYRLTQARETLDEARLLLESGKSLRSVVNRLYYAMFYSILALLVYEPFSSSKHSGVKSYFHKKFIKEEIFPKEMGMTFDDAFELRQSGDYQEFQEPTRAEVEPLIRKVGDFVETVETHLTRKHPGI
jgi:uncharacterized protein